MVTASEMSMHYVLIIIVITIIIIIIIITNSTYIAHILSRNNPCAVAHTYTHRQSHIDLDLHSKSVILIIKIINVDISEILQAIPIMFAVMMVRLKVYIIVSQSHDLALHSRSQMRLKRDSC